MSLIASFPGVPGLFGLPSSSVSGRILLEYSSFAVFGFPAVVVSAVKSNSALYVTTIFFPAYGVISAVVKVILKPWSPSFATEYAFVFTSEFSHCNFTVSTLSSRFVGVSVNVNSFNFVILDGTSMVILYGTMSPTL